MVTHRWFRCACKSCERPTCVIYSSWSVSTVWTRVTINEVITITICGDWVNFIPAPEIIKFTIPAMRFNNVWPWTDFILVFTFDFGKTLKSRLDGCYKWWRRGTRHFPIINIPNILYFVPEKCLKEFRITCWTCLEKASLVHFISLRNFWSCVKWQVWSTFKLFEKTTLVQIRRKIWTKLAFFKTSPTRDSNSSKRQTPSNTFLDQNIRH